MICSFDRSFLRDEIAATMTLAKKGARVAAAREARTRRRPPPRRSAALARTQ
jgi:hypothetical protein